MRASEPAGPTIENPSGRGPSNPAGTVTCGYPATAGGDVVPTELNVSPLPSSTFQAGPDVGHTSASSCCSRRTWSRPSAREKRRSVASASRYTGSVRSVVASAASKIDWSKYLSSVAALALLNAMRSANDRTGELTRPAR